MSNDEKIDREIWLVLQRMREDALLAPSGEYPLYEVIAKSENPVFPSPQNQLKIIERLKSLEAIRIRRLYRFSVKGNHPLESTAFGSINDLPAKGVVFEKISPKFDELCVEYSKYEMDTVNTSPFSSDLWIIKDARGEYWFDGRKVYFENTDAEYVKIFNAVFSLLPQGGKISYEKIHSQYKGANKKNVQRALTGKDANFFQYVKSIERTPMYGVPLFQATRDGKEISFNNQRKALRL